MARLTIFFGYIEKLELGPWFVESEDMVLDDLLVTARHNLDKTNSDFHDVPKNIND